MNRRKKLAVAASAVVMPLGLWASPAHAEETEYSGFLAFAFTDTDGILQESDVAADALYDPQTGMIEITTEDFYEDTVCEVEETTVYVSYLDAAGEQQRLLARSRGGYLSLDASGIAKEAVVTVVQDFLHCDDEANDICSDRPTLNAFDTAPE